MDHSGLRRHLTDPTRYVVRVGVPVFGPHTKVVDGQPRTVDEAELYDWERQSKGLEAATGVAGVLRVGHIRPGEPETNQPPVAGYLTNPRVGLVTLANGDKVKRLLMDEHVRHQWAGRLEDFPWRSVELYRPRKQITAVAMLTRDPQLHDLGPANLYHHAGPDGLELYSLGADPMDDENKPADAPAPPPADPAALMGQLVPMLQQLLAAIQGGPPAPGGAPPGPPPEPMGNAAAPEFYALKTQNDRLSQEVAAMRKGLAQEKAKAVLNELAAEHYAFDAAAELALMTATDDAGRAKRAADIRKYHGKAPADGLIELFQEPVEGPAAEQRAAQTAHAKAMDLMRANPGMTYDAAVAAVTK